VELADSNCLTIDLLPRSEEIPIII